MGMLGKLRDAAAARLPSDRSKIIYNGVVLPADPQIFSERILKAIERGQYEREETALLEKVLEPGDRVLELGAGVGYISTLCSRSEKVEAIVTVEGNPQLREYIEAVHQLNGAHRVKLYSGIAIPNPAVSKMTFYCREDFWGSSLDGKKYRYVSTVEVPTLDLNQLIQEHQPTFLIIDIEGGEADVFNGIELSGVSKIMMELHQEVIGRHAVKAMFDRLSECGFHYDQNNSCGCQLFFSHVDRPLP